MVTRKQETIHQCMQRYKDNEIRWKDIVKAGEVASNSHVLKLRRLVEEIEESRRAFLEDQRANSICMPQ